MPPERRKTFVRGLACYRCNAVWLRRGASPTLLLAASAYLAEYERRRAD